MNRWRLIVLSTLALLLLAGCAAPDSGPVPAADRGRALRLDESRWELQTLGGAGIVPETSIDIRFVNNDEIGGSVDCNGYGSTYSRSDSGDFRLTDRVHHTTFDCERPAAGDSQEAAYYTALKAAASYGVVTVDGGPPALTFYDEAGVPQLTFHERQAPLLDAALAGDWLLEELNGNPPLPGTQIRLSIDLNRYDVMADGFGGCNSYGGPILAASEGSLKAGDIAYTARDCPEPTGVMLQEQVYREALQAAASYEVSDDRLAIASESGEVLLRFHRQEERLADASRLPGSAWRLVSATGGPPDGESDLIFLTERLGLARYAGCAGYLFSYQAGGEGGASGDFRVSGSQALPNVGCPDPGAALETVLPDGYVRHFGLQDDALALFFDDGRELVYEPLPGDATPEGGEWTLLAFVTVEELDIPFPRVAAPQPDLPPRIRFGEGSVRGNAGCNDLSAPYEYDGSALSLGEMAVTESICEGPAELVAQEARFLAELPQAGRMLLVGDLLWLETGENSALLFARRSGE